MRNKRLYMMLSIIALAIGFAAVSTVLYINGTTGIEGNEDFKKNVIFVSATTEEGGTAEISEDGKEIIFTSRILKEANESTDLNFIIKNNDLNYDVDATIECVFINEELEERETDENIQLELDKSTYSIESGKSESGVLTARLKKIVETDKNISIKCTINARAIERTSKGEMIEEEGVLYSGKIKNCSDIDCALDYLDGMVENR